MIYKTYSLTKIIYEYKNLLAFTEYVRKVYDKTFIGLNLPLFHKNIYLYTYETRLQIFFVDTFFLKFRRSYTTPLLHYCTYVF